MIYFWKEEKMYPNTKIFRELYPNGKEFQGKWAVEYHKEVLNTKGYESSYKLLADLAQLRRYSKILGIEIFQKDE
jgi:hypothetical protein